MKNKVLKKSNQYYGLPEKVLKFKKISSRFKKSPSRMHRNMPWRVTDGVKYPVIIYTVGVNGELIFKEVITYE
ncbi:hypothetical protein [Solibacillus sp. NPDC093137]|uniref:hypothetical protein n=1 Tax=Solibacillus sp. NPDC093137 TaxID=3390678 RepID=UPI003D048458